MDRMLLVLRRSPEQHSALLKLLDDQQDKSSANYHKWLTPEQFGQQFGPADADIQAVTSWLHVARLRGGAGRQGPHHDRVFRECRAGAGSFPHCHSRIQHERRGALGQCRRSGDPGCARSRSRRCKHPAQFLREAADCNFQPALSSCTRIRLTASCHRGKRNSCTGA